MRSQLGSAELRPAFYGSMPGQGQPALLWIPTASSTAVIGADRASVSVSTLSGVRLFRIAVAAMLTVTLWLATQAPALAKSGVPPVAGPVVRGFDPPDQPWLSGHRGIDMLAPVGTTVVAAMAGRVSFVGVIAGQPVIVVNHGDTRTTYLPVEASVGVGDQVAAGEELGSLAEGHSCTGGTCLHLGWLRGSTYLDPSQLFDLGAIRLLPSSAVAVAAWLAAQRAALASEGSPGLLAHPANGRIGSGFGMRLHPIFHVWRMHSGVDIGAGCGSPIRAAAGGVVIGRSSDSASGNRLTIDHGMVAGHRLITVYLHAQGYQVRVGQRVTRGQRVGSVGSTGWSTGCHLHFGVKVDGRFVDPQHFL